MGIVKDFFESIFSWAVDIPEGTGIEISQNQSSRNAPIPVVYGRDRVDGANWFFFTTSGTDNRYLYIWCALCEGECEDIEEIFIDGKPLAEFANVQGGINVSSYGSFSGWTGDQTIVIRKYFGADDQTADALLMDADARWTSDHRVRGVCGMAVRLRLREGVFSGRPQISAVVKGRKVDDPRDAGNRWTENAALCLLDYLTNTRYGKGLTWPGDFDTTSWTAAFNDCDATETLITSQTFGTPDEIVTGPDGIDYLRYSSLPALGFVYPGAALTATGKAGDMGPGFMSPGWFGEAGGLYVPFTMTSGADFTTGDSVSAAITGKLFALNITLNAGNEPDTMLTNVRKMLVSMRGNMPDIQGEYHLYVEKDRSSAGAITEDQILEGFEWSGPKKDDKFNRVTVKFRNPNQAWKDDIAIFPEPGSATETSLLAEDGGTPLHGEFDLGGVRNKYQAQDIARILLYKSRDNLQCSFTGLPELLDYHCGQIVTLTHSATGWSSKTFLITKRGLSDDGNVFLQLAEHTAAIYTYVNVPLDLLKDDTTLPDPFEVAAPTSLVINNIADKQFGGVVRAGLDVSWTGIDDEILEGYEVQHKESAGSIWTTRPLQREDEHTFLGLQFNTDYDVRVRAINRVGVKSDWLLTEDHTLGADTTAPGLATGVTLTPGMDYITVAFTPPSDVDLRHFQVFVNTSDSIPGSPEFEHVAFSTEFTITGLTANTTYYVWLKSVDDAGNVSAATASVNATTSTTSSGLGSLAYKNAVDGGTDIQFNAIGAQHIDANAVGSSEIAAGAVDTSELATDAVTREKVAAGELIETTFVSGSTQSDASPSDGDEVAVTTSITAKGDGIISVTAHCTVQVIGASSVAEGDEAVCRMGVEMKVGAGSYDDVTLAGAVPWAIYDSGGDVLECAHTIRGTSESPLYGGTAPSEGDTVTFRLWLSWFGPGSVTASEFRMVTPELIIEEYNNS